MMDNAEFQMRGKRYPGENLPPLGMLTPAEVEALRANLKEGIRHARERWKNMETKEGAPVRKVRGGSQ